MKKILIVAGFCAALTIGARADDARSVVRVTGGDVRISENVRVVIVESLATIRLPKANENRQPVLVTLRGQGGVGTRIVVDGQTIQGLPYHELSAPNASALLHPVDGIGYVQ